MGKAISEDLRWRAVYGVWHDGYDFAQVADRLSMGPLTVSAKWVRVMWQLFCETGDVASHQGRREAPPANRVMDEVMARLLIDQILDSPEFTLNEHHQAFEDATGRQVHISTFCQAVWRCGFSRQRVRLPPVTWPDIFCFLQVLKRALQQALSDKDAADRWAGCTAAACWPPRPAPPLRALCALETTRCCSRVSSTTSGCGVSSRRDASPRSAGRMCLCAAHGANRSRPFPSCGRG